MKISYSQYKTAMECPKQFKFNYVDGLRQQSENEHSMFGTSIHEVIQSALSEYYINKSNITPSHYSSVLFNTMQSHFNKLNECDNVINNVNEENYSMMYRSGVNIINEILGKSFNVYFKNEYSLVGCEYEINYDINDNITFYGKIDVLLKHNDRYIIIDLKTSYYGWSVYKKKDKLTLQQLILYKIFLAKQLNIDVNNIDIMFLLLKKNVFANKTNPFIKSNHVTKFIPPSGRIKQNEAENDILNFIDYYFDSNGNYNQNIEFKASLNNNVCKYCNYKEKCDEYNNRRK
jgi:hypothetical protein